jgi:hypothetical protein
MDWYYIIVLIIATILLIISLVVVGIALTKKGNTGPFPEYQSVCPDFWEVNGSICKPGILGINTPAPQKFVGTTPLVQHLGVVIEDNAVKYMDMDPKQWSGLCDKSKWARSTGIFWDGVANNNSCV